jgi:hypothetical protein
MNSIFTKYNEKKLTIIFIFILYVSLLIGFFLNENSTGGAHIDYPMHKKIAQSFAEDFYKTLFSFDKTETRHSPIFFIFLSFFEKINLEDVFIRLINLHICLLIPIIFYSILKYKFYKISNNFLLLTSGIIFLSPTYRTLSIWPDSRLYGLLIFLISTYYFLKFLNNKSKIIDAVKCTFWIAISSYFSPNFVFFSIFFFYIFFKNFLLKKEILILFLLNIILAAPAFIYVFSLENIFFFKSAIPGGQENLKVIFNFSNKILIVATIIFFYLIPFILTGSIKIIINKINIMFASLIILMICINYFNYRIEFSGGGIFFKLSHLLLKNNYLFYLFSFISLTYLLKICRLDKINLIIIILLILSNVQLTIYHKYYDPLIFILILTILKINLNIKKFFTYKMLILFYIFNLSFLIINLIK